MDIAPVRYDFHTHTQYSNDSLMDPRKLVTLAMARGLSGVAVTDHDSVAGGLEAQALAPRGFHVIVGSEVATTAGDIVGLFLQYDVSTRDPLGAIAGIHEQGGLAFLPHPLRGHRGLTDAVLDAVDAYETLNGRAGWFRPSDGGAPAVDWSLLGSKPALGCTDAHLYRELGGVWTDLTGPATEAGVRDAFRTGQVQARGAPGPEGNFYRSQLIKLVKTRDWRMLLRAGRRVFRSLGS